MCPVAFVFAKGHYAPIAGQEEQVWNEMVIQFFNMSFQWPFRKKARTPPPCTREWGRCPNQTCLWYTSTLCDPLISWGKSNKQELGIGSRNHFLVQARPVGVRDLSRQWPSRWIGFFEIFSRNRNESHSLKVTVLEEA